MQDPGGIAISSKLSAWRDVSVRLPVCGGLELTTLQRTGPRRSGRVERPLVGAATSGLHDAVRGATTVMFESAQERSADGRLF